MKKDVGTACKEIQQAMDKQNIESNKMDRVIFFKDSTVQEKRPRDKVVHTYH